MAKGDYTNSSTISGYQNAVPTNSDAKVVVNSSSKRDRAELLDAVEALYQSAVSDGVDAHDVRSFLHILVKSTDNTLDDDLIALINAKVDAVAGKALSTNDLTDALKANILTNNDKTGITTAQASAITANTAKSDVTISGSTVHSDNYTNTTYTEFTGADGVSPGVAGLVTAPNSTDDTKFLKGDGSWATPAGGGGGGATDIGVIQSGNTINISSSTGNNGTLNTASTTNAGAMSKEDKAKIDHISISQAVDLDTLESNVTSNTAKNSYPSSDQTKVNHLSVTQAVDLDSMETNIAANNAKITNVTTNLSTTADASSLTINSSDGTNASIPAATSSAWGAMTDEDKAKLDGISAGAEANVQSDWNASSGDAKILNKPIIPSGNQIIDWSIAQGSTNIHTANYNSYSAFTGANGSTAGSTGLVPQPTATDNIKFLKGDGTWASASSSGPQAPVLTAAVTTKFFKGQNKTVNFQNLGHYFYPTHSLTNLPTGYSIASKTWTSPTSMSFLVSPPSTTSSSNDAISLSSHISPGSEGYKITFETVDFPQVGEEHAGGVVFYVDEDSGGNPTGHGLIIAKGLISSGFTTDWGCAVNNVISGADASGIGTWSNGVYSGGGKTNTSDILAGCTESGIAAEACDDYSITSDGTTYSDWFLPSKDELNEVYTNKTTLENVSGFTAFAAASHWSSTEYENSSQYAWNQNFSNGTMGGGAKSVSRAVRPIRAY